MESENTTKTFNQRKFVSIGLFLTLAVLIITGILIQIFENFEEGHAIHFFIATHVLIGTLFAILSIFHLVSNWRSMKSYMKTKKLKISKEAVWAVLATLFVVVGGLIVGCFHS